MGQNRILRSLMVLGSANVASAALSVIRMKAMALLLGPAGVGLFGVFGNFVALCGGVLGLGMNHGGVRQIAQSPDDEQRTSDLRWTIFMGMVVQGLLGCLILWLARDWVARVMLEDPELSNAVGSLSIAIFVTMLGVSQTTVLIGFRSLRYVGLTTVCISALGAIAGITAAVVFDAGAIGFIHAQAFATILIAFFFVTRMRRPMGPMPSVATMIGHWKAIVGFGFFLAATELMILFALLAVRVVIIREQGLEIAGYFTAAWAISLLGYGIFSGAMSTDFFPRLTEIIKDRVAANQLIGEQLFFSIALGGPLMLLMIGTADWALPLVYTAEFSEAVFLLKLFALGYIIRLATWPMNTAINALGRSSAIMIIAAVGNGLFFLLTWAGLSRWGLTAAGIGFVGTHLLQLVIFFTCARIWLGFVIPLRIAVLWLINMVAAAALIFCAFTPLIATITAGVGAGALLLCALLSHDAGPRLLARLRGAVPGLR